MIAVHRSPRETAVSRPGAQGRSLDGCLSCGYVKKFHKKGRFKNIPTSTPRAFFIRNTYKNNLKFYSPYCICETVGMDTLAPLVNAAPFVDTIMYSKSAPPGYLIV